MPLVDNKVPTEKPANSRYFQRFQPKVQGFTYGEMRVQLTRRWEDIVFDLTPWLTEIKHAVYLQHL
jgi:hypothetical protein